MSRLRARWLASDALSFTNFIGMGASFVKLAHLDPASSDVPVLSDVGGEPLLLRVRAMLSSFADRAKALNLFGVL
jgi:hypothetical protein